MQIKTAEHGVGNIMSIPIQEFVAKQNRYNSKNKVLNSKDIVWRDTGNGKMPFIINMPTQGSSTSEDPTRHVYLGTIASVGGGGSYTVTVVKDSGSITVEATLLGWNDDYADLVVGQSVYVVFAKGETLTAQIEV
jgi:hypothetical protein